jgi:hypothetical protein
MNERSHFVRADRDQGRPQRDWTRAISYPRYLTHGVSGVSSGQESLRRLCTDIRSKLHCSNGSPCDTILLQEIKSALLLFLPQLSGRLAESAVWKLVFKRHSRNLVRWTEENYSAQNGHRVCGCTRRVLLFSRTPTPDGYNE